MVPHRKIPSRGSSAALTTVEHGQDHFHVLLGWVRSNGISEDDIPDQLAAAERSHPRKRKLRLDERIAADDRRLPRYEKAKSSPCPPAPHPDRQLRVDPTRIVKMASSGEARSIPKFSRASREPVAFEHPAAGYQEYPLRRNPVRDVYVEADLVLMLSREWNSRSSTCCPRSRFTKSTTPFCLPD